MDKYFRKLKIIVSLKDFAKKIKGERMTTIDELPETKRWTIIALNSAKIARRGALQAQDMQKVKYYSGFIERLKKHLEGFE